MGTKEEIRIAAALAKKIDRITRKIDRLIRAIAVTNETKIIWFNAWRSDLKKQYRQAKKAFAEWSINFIPKYYDKIVSDTVNDLKQKKETRNLEIKAMSIKDLDITKTKNNDISVQSKNSLVSESISGYNIALDSGEKELIRLSSLRQQQEISRKQIQQIIEARLFSPDASYDVNAIEIVKIIKKALDGKYISVVGKDGKLRMWNVKSYTEMFVRTKLRETASVAVVNTALTVGSDLIQVSSHNTTTPICIPFEGKILSISGSDKDFDQATDIPPFHPNCLHVITVIFRSVLERRGIKKYSDFSQGRTEIHPTRTAHIPASNMAARIKNAERAAQKL